MRLDVTGLIALEALVGLCQAYPPDPPMRHLLDPVGTYSRHLFVPKELRISWKDLHPKKRIKDQKAKEEKEDSEDKEDSKDSKCNKVAVAKRNGYHNHNTREYEDDDESNENKQGTRTIKPGYENVVPGYEWAGPGVVTETPCADSHGCPPGRYLNLPSREGVPRIGLHFGDDLPIPTAKPWSYENAMPAPSWPDKSYDQESKKKDKEAKNEDEYAYKNIHRHKTNLSKRSPISPELERRVREKIAKQRANSKLQRRAPCKKKKEEPIIDPDAPLPRLSTHQLLNIEGIPHWKRKYVVDKLPFDDESKKQFMEFKELDADMITKLNELYAAIYYDDKYDGIKDHINRPSKYTAKWVTKEIGLHKRNAKAPKLTQKQLDTIENLKPYQRTMAAQKLDINPKLARELFKAKKLTPELVDALNKEYVRIWENREKYKTVLGMLNVKWKRGEKCDPELSDTQIAELKSLGADTRILAAYAFDFPKPLVEEYAVIKVFTPEFIAKLNKEYARVLKEPKKYERVLKRLGAKRKRSAPGLTDAQMARLIYLSAHDRKILAKEINLDEETTRKFVEAEHLTPELVTKFNSLHALVHDKHESKPPYHLSGHLNDRHKRDASGPDKEAEELGKNEKEVREMIAKDLELDESLTEEFVLAKKLTTSLVEKFNDILEDKQEDSWYQDILRKILGEFKSAEVFDQEKVKISFGKNPEAKNSSDKDLKANTTSNEDLKAKASSDKELKAKVALGKTPRTKIPSDQGLKAKLSKSKENGWCNEFLGELEDTLGEGKKDSSEKKY
ncbi:hypothetical protein FHETE_5246 [Fusarium heterosporum]|uniref:Uncharacterized protein n=1 Tax=Fusarium heterosporum TaxID=42747 RepID=A0A8H5WRR0_FUSHE|nr:hypothetical protein FHETE_5246 [Fusarium heterosporum]